MFFSSALKKMHPTALPRKNFIRNNHENNANQQQGKELLSNEFENNVFAAQTLMSAIFVLGMASHIVSVIFYPYPKYAKGYPTQNTDWYSPEDHLPLDRTVGKNGKRPGI